MKLAPTPQPIARSRAIREAARLTGGSPLLEVALRSLFFVDHSLRIVALPVSVNVPGRAELESRSFTIGPRKSRSTLYTTVTTASVPVAPLTFAAVTDARLGSRFALTR